MITMDIYMQKKIGEECNNEKNEKRNVKNEK